MDITRIKAVLLYLLLTFFFATCSPCASQLSQAERLLEIDPAAADSVLSSIPVPRSSRERALYAVLKTQADYKLYKAITSDSLILTATRYYGSNRKNFHAALAWYSQGCVYTELHNNMAAIDAYLKAEDLFPDTLLRYYALTEQQLGTRYLEKMMLHQAQIQFEGCKINAERIGDIKTLNYVTIRLGLCALYSQDFTTADSIFSRILRDSTFSQNHKNEALFQLAKVESYCHKDYQSALFFIDSYLFNKRNNSVLTI